MRALLHVAARTLVERRTVLVAAAVAALLPVLYSLLPWVGAENSEELRTLTALVIAAGFSLLVALLYGATCLARDLREHRLSYYYARPLPAASLWFGKLLAGMLLGGGTIALVLLPSLLLGTGIQARDWPRLELAGGATAAILAAVVLGHSLAVMLGTRSGWLAVDLMALVVMGVGAATIFRLILNTGDSTLLYWVTRITAFAAVAGLVAGGLAQVAVGRTDARSGHRALSLTLWSACLPAVAGLLAYTLFLLNPTPSSLATLDNILTAPGGESIVVSGYSRWRSGCEAMFVLDVASGRHIRLGRPTNWHRRIALSADGSRVVWLQPLGRPRASPVQVMALDLSRTDERPRPTRIVLDRYGASALAISDDGRLIALQEDRLLTVVDVESGSLLASVRLPESSRTSVIFTSSDRLRIEQRVAQHFEPQEPTPSLLTVSALDLPDGHLRETGRRALPEQGSEIVARSVDSGTLVMRDWFENEAILAVYDGWTLVRQAELGRSAAPRGRNRWSFWGRRSAAVLSDGRMVIGEADPSGARLRLVGASGLPIRTIALGPWRCILVGAEVSPGRLAVSLSRTAPGWTWEAAYWDECSAVDLESGARTRIGDGVTPLVPLWAWSGRPAVRPGNLEARVFVAPGRLVAWNPLDPAKSHTVVEWERDLNLRW